MVDFLYSFAGIAILVTVGLILGGALAWWKVSNEPKPEKPKTDSSTWVQSPVVAVVFASLVGLFQTPSISIDIALIFSYASDIVTMLMPIVGVGAGISFGFALVAYIIRLFRQIF
ncbi:MAG: hypothetical protein HC875_21200 [Anaerolineales bacterium]|nr:hypothetical protein [Anaerolineales bacterium]